MSESVLASADATSDRSEDNLVRSAARGDVGAFEAIFERFKEPLFRFVMRSIGSRDDAEDIVQEAFCKAWQSMDSFRGDCRLLTWLCRIAANICIDRSRKRQRRVQETTLDAGVMQDLTADRHDLEGDAVLRAAIDKALAQLPASHRMLVVLCDIQGFQCPEAAAVVGCSHLSARVRLCRARKKMRQLLSAYLNEVI